LPFIRQLNTKRLRLGNWIGGNSLKENLVIKTRDELEAKMAAVFGEEIKELSTELREILLDDMVTAFENRINVLNRSKIGCGF
jgi:hypothetical protein